MPSEARLDLSAIRRPLESLFQKYPAGNHCDVCAERVGKELRKAGFDVDIVTIQNEEIPGLAGVRPSYIQAKKPDGGLFLLALTGFHQANRIHTNETSYYLDALVYWHYGVAAVDEDSYFSLFEYPESIEITQVEKVV